MELWRLYKFLKYINEHPNTEYVKIQAQYDELHGDANALWDIAVSDQYVNVNDGVHPTLRYKGKQLVEMHGYGFLVQAIKEYGGPVVLLAGIASIVNLLVIIL